MQNLSTPIRFGLLGLVAGLIGYGISTLLGLDLESPWWVFVLAGGVGGYVGGVIRQKRGK